MAAIQYARLYPDALQLQAKNGTNLTAGWVMVFLAGTDDPATTYADFNGTLNPQKIVIDDNGRFTAIVDKSQAYRVEVYDSEGMLQWTTEPVWCTGNSGSGMSVTRVVSTDGSISVDENIDGTERTYDIGLAPSSTEFLEWCKCLNLSISNGLVSPVFAEGTMTTDEGGLHVYKDRYYHLTCTLRVDPTGNGINYDTLSVNLKFSDGTEVDLVRRNYDIDNSVNDPTLCEFSYDFNCPADGYLYLYVEGVSSFEQVDVALQVHRVYSGINAVPDTCATQQWVRGYFDFNLSGKVDYSAIEYNQDNEITGISGSAIAGNMNSAQVSAIASSYAESAVSSMSGSISSKLDASASSEFYSTSNPSGFLTAHQSLAGYATEAYVDSSVSSKLDTTAFSTVSGDFLTSHQSLAGYATESYVDSAVSSKLDVTASSQFLTGLPDDIAYTSDVASAVSGKLDASASSSFYPMTGNPSGFLTAHQSLAGLATVEYVDSSVSSKLDISAYDSAEFYTTANPSGFVNSSYVDSAVSSKLDASASSDFVQSASMSSWIPYSALDYSGTAISGIGGSALAGMGGGGDYTGVAPVIVDNNNRTISVDHKTLCVDETMTAYDSGSSAVIGVNTATVLSGLSDYQLTADMTAYQLSGDYYSATNPSGFIDSAYVEGQVSGKQDKLTFGYDDSNNISSIDGSALAGGGGGGIDSATCSAIASSYAESAVSGKADSSALSSYVPYSSLEYNTASAISGINGSALAAGSTYSAGEGIDITDDVISVEAPVDIVAGPGIVVDNPDGNTLRVSTDENYETVLWEGTAASVDTAKSGLTLTESPFNFEYVEVHWVPWAYNDAGSYKQEAVVRVHLTSSFPRIGLINEWTAESNAAMFMFSVNGYFTSTKFYTTHIKWFQIGDWIVNNTGTGQYITKIVGIHRIANN